MIASIDIDGAIKHITSHPTRFSLHSASHRMDSNPSQDDKQSICICRKYCNGQPRLLPERTFYRHLAEAPVEEKPGIVAVKAISLDGARAILVHRGSPYSQQDQIQSPAPAQSQSVRRTKTERALAKRARETPDSDGYSRIGKRKSARTQTNSRLSASLPFHFLSLYIFNPPQLEQDVAIDEEIPSHLPFADPDIDQRLASPDRFRAF